MTAAPSQVVVDDRYCIERPLSEGGVAVVYRARDLQSDVTVAIKVLKPEFVDHDSLRPRFEREAQLLAELEHPNIVRVTDFGLHEGSPYLVMDLLEGRTLRALLDQGPPAEDKVRLLVVELLQGLTYAHARGVIHRDLKPGNLFLHAVDGAQDQLKILDFGFAKLLSQELRLPEDRDLTRLGTAFGTPSYMAPEQITLGAMDARTDLYGAGIVLFEMLAGTPPFQGELAELLAKQLNEKLPAAERSDTGLRARPELQALLERTLAKRAADRYESAAELRDALTALPEPWLVSARGKAKRPSGKPRVAPPPVPPKLSAPQPPPAARVSLPQPPSHASIAQTLPRISVPAPRASVPQSAPRVSLPEPPRPPARASTPKAPKASTSKAPGAQRSSKDRAPGRPIDLPAAALDLDERRLIADLQAGLERGPDKERAARLHMELGLLYERMDGELERACDHYQRSLALCPDRVVVLRHARLAWLELGKPEQALALLERELAARHEPDARAVLLHEKGKLLEHRLHKHDQALATYEEALLLDASDLDLLRAASRLQRRGRRWEALDTTLELLANAVQGDVAYRAAVITERARVVELRRNEPNRALELYLAALALDPDAAGGLEAVRRLSEDLGQWQTLLQSLEQEALRARDPEQVANVYAQIAGVHLEHTGDREQGIGALERSVATLPDERSRWLALAELYAEANRSRDLVTALEHCARLSGSPSERGAHLVRMARCMERELAAPAEAERCYQQALELDPRSRPLFESLAALYEKTGNHPALMAALARRWDAELEPAAKAELSTRMGGVSERLLGDVEQAVERYKAALALEPNHPGALRALDRLLPGLGRHRELAQTYERVVDHSPHAEQAILYLFRLGALYEDRLGEPAGALHAYERVLKRAPSHLGALHALQRAAASAGEFERLTKALEREAELLKGSARSAELLVHSAGVLAGSLGQASAAIERLRRVLAIDPNHQPAIDRLAVLYRAERRWDDLVALHQGELERVPSGAPQVGLLCELGELCEHKLGRVPEAIGYYERALLADAGHGAAWRALERLLRAAEAFPKLAEWLERRASLGDPRERAERACELAALYATRLSAPERALAAYGRALSAVPAYGPALEGRARMLGSDKKPARLVEALVEHVDLAGTSLAAIDAGMRAAALQAELLGDARAARVSYAKVRALAPGQIGPLRALEALEHELGDEQALCTLLTEQVGRAQNDQLQASLLRDLVAIAEAGSDAPETLTETYRSILALAPGDAVALRALCRIERREQDAQALAAHEAALAARSDDRLDAATHQLALASTLEATDPAHAMLAFRAALALDPESLLAVRGLSRTALALADAAATSEAARREASITRDPAVSASLWLAAARMRAAEGDLDGAAAEAERALDAVPDHEGAADALRRCLFEVDEVARLCDVLARAAGGASPPRAATLHAEVAALYAERLGDPSSAITAAERALASDPNHLPALELLSRLLHEAGQQARAVASYERLLAVTQDPARVERARLSIAELALGDLRDPGLAHRHLRAILAARPDHSQALALELRMLLDEGDHDSALELARRRLEIATEPQDRVRALLDVAVAERASGRMEAADQALCEAIAVEGPNGEASRAYRAQTRTTAQYRAYAGALEQHLSRALERRAGVAESAQALAHAQAELLDDQEGAFATLQRALAACPDAVDLALQLAKRLHGAGRPEEAIAIYRREAPRAPERAELFRGLADAQRAAGRPDEALAAGVPLLVLDADEAQERVLLRSRQPRPAASGPGQLAEPLLREIGPGGAFDTPVLGLAQSLSSTFAKVFPADLKRYGVSRKDRVATQTDHPLRAAADRVARLVGAENFELYVHGLPEPDIAIELAETPALLVPRALVSSSRSKLVFALCRKLLLVAHDLAVVARAPEGELAPFLLAAARRQLPGFGSELFDDDTIAGAERALSRALPWLSRKRVDEAAAHLSDLAPNEVEAFGTRMRFAANRAALLLSDDLVGSVELLRAASSDPHASEPAACDLLAFWIGEVAARYRSRLLS